MFGILVPAMIACRMTVNEYGLWCATENRDGLFAGLKVAWDGAATAQEIKATLMSAQELSIENYGKPRPPKELERFHEASLGAAETVQQGIRNSTVFAPLDWASISTDEDLTGFRESLMKLYMSPAVIQAFGEVEAEFEALPLDIQDRLQGVCWRL